MVTEEFVEKKRNEIRDMRIKHKDYLKAIKKCNDFLRIVNLTNNNDDKWFIYHNIGLNSKKLNLIDEAYENELIALNYTNSSLEDVDYRYIYSTWLLALCAKEKGEFKNAIKLFDGCSKRYKKIGDEIQRLCTLHEKAKLYKDSKAMEKFLRYYESKTLNITIQTHGDLEYSEVHREMVCDLFELYTVEGKKEDSFKLLYKIRDKKLKKGLMLKLRVA